MKRLLFLLPLFLLTLPGAFAQQIKDAIQWQYNAKKTSDSSFDVTITAKINAGWHVYTATPKGDGTQTPLHISFNKNPNVKLIGKAINNGKPINEEIKELGYSIQYYKNGFTYTQKVIAHANTSLKGVIDFQICNDQMCLPQKPQPFQIPLNGVVGSAAMAASDTVASNNESMSDSTNAAALNAGNGTDTNNKELGGGKTVKESTAVAESKTDTKTDKEDEASLLSIFLKGLGAGFAAFVTPCIYAMLPITVSFFTKRSKNRSTGIRNAVFYSLSIVGIFSLIGVLISLFFKEDTMYVISTSIYFNLFVFTVFIIFGISLLGAFEITLPSSWSTKLDNKANSTSFGGIFFMALVLVVVSFSCTSAFISFLIVQIVQAHNRIGGLV